MMMWLDVSTCMMCQNLLWEITRCVSHHVAAPECINWICICVFPDPVSVALYVVIDLFDLVFQGLLHSSYAQII